MLYLMKSMFFVLSILVSICAYSGPVIDGKKVQSVNSQITEECTLFKLEGITATSPARPNDPWFAIPNNSPSHDAALSILLAAYMSGKAVRININEADTCGSKSGINYVRFSEL